MKIISFIDLAITPPSKKHHELPQVPVANGVRRGLKFLSFKIPIIWRVQRGDLRITRLSQVAQGRHKTMILKARIGIVAFVLAQAGLAVGAEPPEQGRETPNTFPEPGYTLLGAYRDADPRFFDYEAGHILRWSGDTFPNTKQ